MAIDSISSTAAPLPQISPLVDKTKKLPPTPTAESDAAAAATDTQAATTTTPATPPPAAAAAPSAPPAAPVQSEAAAVSTATATLDTTYSTTVGGKSYSANVSETNGTYTLAVPGLPGASVSGTSLSSAEAALGGKIDTLV